MFGFTLSCFIAKVINECNLNHLILLFFNIFIKCISIHKFKSVYASMGTPAKNINNNKANICLMLKSKISHWYCKCCNSTICFSNSNWSIVPKSVSLSQKIVAPSISGIMLKPSGQTCYLLIA